MLCCVSILFSSQYILLFPFWFLLWPICYWGVNCLISMYLWFYQIFFLLLSSNFIPLWSKNILCIVLIFSNYWGLLYGLAYSLSCRMFHVYLRRMFILLLLYWIFYECLLGLAGLEFYSSLPFPCWSLCPAVLSSIDSGLLKYLTLIVEVSFLPFLAINFALCILVFCY